MAVNDLLVEKVLRCVELVPAGRVVAYGDVARIVGTAPRVVGAVMATHGHLVSWWRVTDVSGQLRPDLLERARPHWQEEGITLVPGARGCRIAAHRADLDELAARWAADTTDLPAE
ncbi:MGMT family protein [Kytococcus sp. Marseille-QA3725]